MIQQISFSRLDKLKINFPGENQNSEKKVKTPVQQLNVRKELNFSDLNSPDQIKNSKEIDDHNMSRLNKPHNQYQNHHHQAREMMIQKLFDLHREGRITDAEFEDWIFNQIDSQSPQPQQHLNYNLPVVNDYELQENENSLSLDKFYLVSDRNKRASSQLHRQTGADKECDLMLEQDLSSIRLRTDRVNIEETVYSTVQETETDTDRSKGPITTYYGGVSDIDSLARDTDREINRERKIKFDHYGVELKSKDYIFSDDGAGFTTIDDNGRESNIDLDYYENHGKNLNETTQYQFNLEGSTVSNKNRLESNQDFDCQQQQTTERLLLNMDHKVHLPSSYLNVPKAGYRRQSSSFTLGYNSTAAHDRLRDSENNNSVQSKPISYLDLDRYRSQSDSNKTFEEVDIMQIDLVNMNGNFYNNRQKNKESQNKNSNMAMSKPNNVNYFGRKNSRSVINGSKISNTEGVGYFIPSSKENSKLNVMAKKLSSGGLAEEEYLGGESQIGQDQDNGYAKKLPYLFTSIKESDREYVSNVRLNLLNCFFLIHF